PPLTSPLFPYTTLFRSDPPARACSDCVVGWLDRGIGLHRGHRDRSGSGLADARAATHVFGARVAAALLGTRRRRGDILALLGRRDRKSTRLNSSHDQIS